jgi:hypothetical protein
MIDRHRFITASSPIASTSVDPDVAATIDSAHPFPPALSRR